MTLRDKQVVFWRNVAKLIIRANILGTPIFINEWLRSIDTQKKNVAAGASKTMNSKHIHGLAIDAIFIDDVNDDGKVNFVPDKYKALGEYWESLDIKNVWGGRWGDDPETTKIEGWDSCHFEYNGS